MTAEPRPMTDAHLEIAGLIIEMMRLTRELFFKQRPSLVAAILSIGRDVHQREKALTAAVPAMEPADLERVFVPMHFERVGDNIEALARAIGHLQDEGVVFTDRAMREIGELLDKALELLEATRDVLRTGSPVLTRYVLTEGPAFEALATDFALFHQERLIQGVCQPKASSIFLAIVDYLRGVERHQRQIVEKLAVRSDAARPVASNVVAYRAHW